MWIFCIDLINQPYGISIKAKNKLLLSTEQKQNKNRSSSYCQEKQKASKKYSPTMKQVKMWFDFEQPVEYNFFKFWPWGLENSLSSNMD